MITDVLVPDLI
jgi:hypothetical protein